MNRKLFIFWAIFMVPLFAHAQRQTENFYYSDPEKGDGKVHAYLLYLPPDYQVKPNESFPLLVFLHGAGERGELNYNALRRHGPSKLVQEGWDFPFIVASPQSYKYAGKWEPKVVDEFVEKMKNEHRIDESRIYVTGISMGGAGTWNYVIDYPEKVAAAVPICGWANIPNICNMANVPVWAFHNEGDNTVGVGGTINAISNLEKCSPQPSVEPQMVIYPTGGHDAWTKTYNKSAGHDIYSWLLQQSKKEAPKNEHPVEINNVKINPESVYADNYADITISANIEGNVKGAYADISEVSDATQMPLSLKGSVYQCSFKAEPLSPGKKNITIKAVDSDDKVTSSVLTLEVLNNTDESTPSVPVVTDNSVTYTSIKLKWSSSTDNVGVKNYNIYLNGKKTASTENLTATLNDLNSATEYIVGLSAEDVSGNESNKAILQVSTLNRKPIAEAGSDLDITLPENAVGLQGSASDSDGEITGIEWRLLEGPNEPGIENEASLTTQITDLTAGEYVFQLVVTDDLGSQAYDEVRVMVNPENLQVPTDQPYIVYRINSGGGLIEDEKMDWQNDYRKATSPYFSSSSANASTGWNYFPYLTPNQEVPAIVFGTFRYGPSWGGDIEYNIPIGPGKYIVKLYFAEDRTSGIKSAGKRIFDVSCENKIAIDQLDIYGEAGLNGLVKTFEVTVDDQNLDIKLLPVKGLTLINGIEILSFEQSIAKKNFENLSFGDLSGSLINATLYPNPVDNIINLSFNKFIEGDLKISILNSAGVVMLRREQFISFGLSEATLDISDYNFKEGIYFVNLQVNGHTFKQLKLYKK